MKEKPSFYDDRISGPQSAGLPVERRLVSIWLDDSLSMLGEEVELIDRLFGGEIAALFKRFDDGGSNL